MLGKTTGMRKGGGSARDPLPPSNHAAAEGFTDNFQFPWQPAPAQPEARVASLTYIQQRWDPALRWVLPGEEALRGNTSARPWRGQPAESLDKGTPCPHLISFPGPVLLHLRPATCKFTSLICNILRGSHQGTVNSLSISEEL